MNLGNIIYDLRKKKDVTQEEMAAELGITAAAISKWENNYTLPDIIMLCALADYFHVTTDTLLGRNTHLKYAIIAASSTALAKKIEAVATRYGIIAAEICDNFAAALDAANAHPEVDYILVSCKQILTEAEHNAAPAKLRVVESQSDDEQQIIRGFDMILQQQY